MKVHGSCHCGAIRFEADADPQKAGVCHCTDCQSLTGSAFSLFIQVPKEAFRLTGGEPKIYVKTAQSGNRRAQAFCANCGTRLWAAAEKDSPVYNLRIGTLGERAQLTPRVQVWCRSALPWIEELAAVPKKTQGA
ncbi:MAG TPA: GFA family protein [Burkholderiales bacterium]|nr:GFA family protein [Burkholderiales bacterium]